MAKKEKPECGSLLLYFTRSEALHWFAEHEEFQGPDGEVIQVVGIRRAELYVLECEGVDDPRQKYELTKTEYEALTK